MLMQDEEQDIDEIKKGLEIIHCCSQMLLVLVNNVLGGVCIIVTHSNRFVQDRIGQDDTEYCNI